MSEEQVKDILSRYANGESMGDLAAEYGVHRSVIEALIKPEVEEEKK